MMKDRIKSVYEHSGMSQQEWEQKTQISWYKWGNLFTGKQRVNEDHIAAICKLWPNYAYWITTGLTLPEAGQISPEIEETREKLSKAG